MGADSEEEDDELAGVVAVVALLLWWPALVGAGCPGGPAEPGSSHHLHIELSHPLFLAEPPLQPAFLYLLSVRATISGLREVGVSIGGECIFSGPGPPANFTTPRAGNITFRITYRLEGDPTLLEVRIVYPITQDCDLEVLSQEEGEFGSSDLPPSPGCVVRLPPDRHKTGLLLTILKLNVPCSQGSLRLLPETKLCGKLEELGPEDRQIYFQAGPPEVRALGGPVFRLRYMRVDPCYNTTLKGRNGSVELSPLAPLDCTYNVLLPYGYRAAYTVQIGGQRSEGYYEPLDLEAGEGPCAGLSLTLWDGSGLWSHCALSPGVLRELRRISSANTLRLRVSAGPDLPDYPPLYIRYEAVGDSEVVGGCPWPGVAVQLLCVWLSSERESWPGAEAACSAHGGHLVSVTSQRQQDLIDIVILNSPDYREDEAFWVGGTDMRVEGDFRWSDARPFAYTNWFGGWRGSTNRQPNDDGLSGQDCIELRRMFGQALAPGLRWNDRDCSARNRYLCEVLPTGERMPSSRELLAADCNRTVALSLEEPVGVVTSPGFPDHYPDDAACITVVTAPPAFTVLVEFEELVLETEPSCSYDYVEVSGSNGTRRFCGDLSDRLKLLRQVFAGPKVRIKFVSDYSHHFPGFKARVSVGHSWPECGSDKLWPMFNNSCYLVVSYPEVSWTTANKICTDIKGELASVHSASEDRFVVTKIRESLGYSTSAVYWLGATYNGSSWSWGDDTRMDFTGWAENSGEQPGDQICLGLQYRKSPGPDLPSALYWTPQPCDMVGGYVCKKSNQGQTLRKEMNVTVNGTEGRLVSPGYPDPYPIGAELWSRVQGPPGHRLVIRFEELDLEPQADCLYDWIQVDEPPVRLCGHRTPEQLQRLQVVTTSNSALIHFHSDYSVSGGGWALSWRAVDVSGCPLQSTTAKQGELTSPNYPHFLLSGLDCATTILAPEGKRVWLELEVWEVRGGGLVLDLGGGAGRLVPYSLPHLLSDGSYLSAGERMQITLRTGDNPQGRGYKALYKTVEAVSEDRVVFLNETTSGKLLHLNYPLEPPPSANFTLRLLGPIGYLIHLQFHEQPLTNGVEEVIGDKCSMEENLIEVTDPYGDRSHWVVCRFSLPLTFTSYLNSIRVKQVFQASLTGIRLNATVSLIPDAGYRLKLRQGTDQPVESCSPNPCQNGGKCVTSIRGLHSCQCVSHFTGLLCGLTACETEPCQFGNCSLTGSGFRCHCFPGYLGRTCDLPQRPCSSNPCDSRGECIQTNKTAFKCKCHAWWEGARCERRMMHIPYKPLSSRMLQEPFWLGLITVTGVLGILGLFWCAKRHFPEKLEKLLAEEDSRRPSSGPWGGAGQSWDVPDTNGMRCSREAQPASHRSSLLGRLGIRKPSLPAAPTSRTFSLDDLLKPPTTPSPRKKRNNSTPVKKTCASEKKQILQQLVTPVGEGARSGGSGESGGEVIPLAIQTKPAEPTSCTPAPAETSFTSAVGGRVILPESGNNSKLEKKVTFARLLDKVSSEMSSGSELEVTSLGPIVASPNSTSSQQGSDSRSSSETQLHGIVNACEPRKGRKTASADSILAMFRNFPGVAGAAGGLESSTTTCSTRDEVAGSDDSSTNTPMSSSSGIADSPPLFMSKTTIQVSVLDPLSAQKTSNSLHPSSLLQPPTILLEAPNKCLSPIRELPTPSPSPALTPVMGRALLSPLPSKSSPVVPLLRVEAPGSPPPRRPHKPHLKDMDKPNSLDLPYPPPLITITCSMTEAESDADSPATTKNDSGGMCYLSPFSVCSRNDRTTSESNLSSSGYSSMASPGPSRCGSNNPLCPTDAEDGHRLPRRPSPLLRAPSTEEKCVGRRGRSDSETTSDDHQPESNDEGFGTDQLEEKIEEGELKSAKELEAFLGERSKSSTPVKHCGSVEGLEECVIRVKQCASVEAGLDRYKISPPPPVRHCGSAGEGLALLRPPAIVVEGGRASSPVSSRSESPLSDKTGLGRFSPMFYGRMTDSDGLYDCGGSSDCCKRKQTGRRKERRRSKSPTNASQILLQVPGKNTVCDGRTTSRSKPSPKRRTRPHPLSSTSSSSAESLNSIRDVTLCISGDMAERLAADGHWSPTEDQHLIFTPPIQDLNSKMLPNEGEPGIKSQRKISKMRTVGHQIRFLHRLEQSLQRTRGRVTSPERPLLGGEGRSAKRSSWLKSRGAVSDSAGGHRQSDWEEASLSVPNSGYTD